MTDWSVFYDDTRSDWNARQPTSTRTSVDISRRTEFFNHYIGPGSPNFMARPHADCLAKVREWQAYHQSKGWKDIGYNALVCGHARVIEGRGLGYSGSHCPDHNTSGFGVQFMVAGTEKPTDAMYARMRRLYDELVKAKGGPLAKRGHRDGTATTCPGDIVYAWVRAGMPMPAAPKPPAPTPTPTPAPTIQENPDMFMVRRKDKPEVYKTDGFKRIHITATERDALKAAGVKLYETFTTDEQLAAFGPVEGPAA
jgi:hypothetical protein